MTDEAHDWDASYREREAPPWDIGRPQPVIATLAREGRLVGDLLDAGCGTGEHALLAASVGATAVGVDLSPTAIEVARSKATARGLTARFEVGDILHMSLPTSGFDTVVDTGLFHVFDDDDRQRYVDVLRTTVRAGGHCYLMCFSDRQPGDWGPRRVTRAELDEAFSAGWSVERVDEATFDINPLPEATIVQAWLAVVRRQP